LKANPNSHATKHQKSKLKILFKKKIKIWKIAKAQHMCVLAKVDAFSFWKKYQPRAPIVDKITIAMFLKGFHKLVG